MNISHTPTERLILMALTVKSYMTAEDLQAVTGTKTINHLHRAFHTLYLASIVERSNDTDATRYSLSTASQLITTTEID